jgi:hypothetical protein
VNAPVLLVLVLVLLIVAVEFQFDTEAFDTQSALSMPGLSAAVIVVRYIFTTPRPYQLRKAWCPTCANTDAIHDWTDDPTFTKCESNLRAVFNIAPIIHVRSTLN